MNTQITTDPLQGYLKGLNACRDSALMSWALGDTALKTTPWLTYISLANACNNKCVFCAQPKVMRETKGVMSKAVFERIVHELPSTVSKVYLMKQGEPLLHKDLVNMAGFLKKKRPNIHLAMHTNGILANKATLANLLPVIDSIGFSISAVSRDLYHKVHGTDGFEAVVRNLEDLSCLMATLPKTSKPHVFIDYVQMSQNQQESQQEVVAFFKRFGGLSSVDFHWENNYQGVIAEANLQIYDTLDPACFPCCVFPWSSITFLWDGMVDYCFVEAREDRFLGDITKQSFQDIWNGKDYLTFRKHMAARDFAALHKEHIFCDKCTWLWQPKVQAPLNLCGGYQPCHGTNKRRVLFADVLEKSLEQAFDMAVDQFLQGEIAMAMGIAEHVALIADDEKIKNHCRTLKEYGLKIMEQFKHQDLWQKALARECLQNKRFEKGFNNTYWALFS